MTHQSLILLATLLVLAGLAIGYWIGWAWDRAKPYVAAGVGVVTALRGIWFLDRDVEALFTLCLAIGLVEEAFADTEAAA